MQCDATTELVSRRVPTAPSSPQTLFAKSLCACLLLMITTYQGNVTATRGGCLGGVQGRSAPRTPAGAGGSPARFQCRLAPCVAPARRVSATEASLWVADAPPPSERAQRATSSGLASSSSPADAARRASWGSVSAQAGHECAAAAGVGERRGVPRLEALGLHRTEPHSAPRAKVCAHHAGEVLYGKTEHLRVCCATLPGRPGCQRVVVGCF